MIWLHLLVFFLCILVGTRLKGLAMGTMAGVGLMVLIFFFGLPPGQPPTIVLGMILAVITALSALEAAGGLDYLVKVAARLMAKHPQYITFLAPMITYLFTMAAGTQSIVYALLPVISEISRKAGVRPERPLTASVIASMFGLISSPISAAMVAFVGLLTVKDVSLAKILIIIIPSCVVAIFMASLSVAWRGKSLADDQGYQDKLSHGDFEVVATNSSSQRDNDRNAMGGLLLFGVGILFIVLIGLYPNLKPTFEVVLNGVVTEESIGSGAATMVMMLAVAGLIMLFFKAGAEQTIKTKSMSNGIIAIISILGISWMGSTFFEGNRQEIVDSFSGIINSHPWIFALGLFFLSVLLFSQAATIITLVPIVIGLNMSAPLIVGFYPAVNGLFFLPTYGTVIAAVAFDRTGTTTIGKYLLNHSFMLPGLVGVFTATVLSLILSHLVL